MTNVPRPILVGVDGSAASADAVRWAVEEAARTDAPLVAVLAWSYIDQPTPGFDPGFDEHDADTALAAFLRDAVGTAVAERIERRVICDLPGRAVVGAAADASLVVVGARGAGGFAGLRLGSVADRVAQRSPVPAVVVCGPGAPAGRVVVGDDGSATSGAAVQWAAAAALARGVALQVVRTWEPPVTGDLMLDPRSAIYDKLRAAAEAETTATVNTIPPGLEVIVTVREGGAARRLLEAAESATLLVVGRRRVGGLLAGLGSVSRQVVHHASCAVAVIPPSE